MEKKNCKYCGAKTTFGSNCYDGFICCRCKEKLDKVRELKEICKRIKAIALKQSKKKGLGVSRNDTM